MISIVYKLQHTLFTESSCWLFRDAFIIVIFGLINQNKSQQFEAFDCDNAEDGKFFKHEVGCY